MPRIHPAFVLASLLTAAAPAHAAGLEDLRWLAGSWGRDTAGTREEEHWTAPRGGLMVGMHRDVTNGRAVSFEFLRIAATDSGIVYFAQPKGQPATPFKLKDLSDRRVVFENQANDFPQRILYWMEGATVLHARIEGTWNGKTESADWRWRRLRLDR